MLVKFSTLLLIATSALAYTIKVEDGRTFTWTDVADNAVIMSGHSQDLRVASRDGRPKYRPFVLDSAERGKFVFLTGNFRNGANPTFVFGRDKLCQEHDGVSVKCDRAC